MRSRSRLVIVAAIAVVGAGLAAPSGGLGAGPPK